MIGTILCLVGLHRWEWVYRWVPTGYVYNETDWIEYNECHSYVRCKRGCKHYDQWRRIRQDVRTTW